MYNVVQYVSFQTKTCFMPFRVLYPECNILIQGEPNLYNLMCLRTQCTRNTSCMEVLAKRVYYFFQEVEPQAEMLLLYFKHNTSIKAGVFSKNLDEPRLITLNQSGFKKFQKEGEVREWFLKDDFLAIYNKYKTDNIITAENLIRK